MLYCSMYSEQTSCAVRKGYTLNGDISGTSLRVVKLGTAANSCVPLLPSLGLNVLILTGPVIRPAAVWLRNFNELVSSAWCLRAVSSLVKMVLVASLAVLLVAAVMGQEQTALPPGIAYSCGNSTLTVFVETTVLADAPASLLRLGTCPPSGFKSPHVILFQYGLRDCWGGRLISDTEIIFWNYLKFEESPALGMNRPRLNARLECRYPVNEIPTPEPTVPVTGVLSGEGKLIFSMKIMTDDWAAERPDSLFFLGASINLQASVLATYHQALRLYMEECIATPTSSLGKSLENYSIINNHGCLIDGKTGNSKFLPRNDGSLLQFVVQAFKFNSREDADIFIHCKALVWDPKWDDLLHKACSFDQQTESWQLLDAPLQSSLCDCCNAVCQPIQSRHKRSKEVETSVGHVIKVGPLRVISKQSRSKTLDLCPISPREDAVTELTSPIISSHYKSYISSNFIEV
ncbi:zona pellucida sperm-binding protein 3-like isoform X2 [Hypanus sabinus]|uniref:zona pellucida sperm-binding protein 3-like isoform X2 n=1 Tax=Hypanus sabinus TaxID=79690 RepID=UPI0028C4B956|nr:zona pellucida sperm-binding protein 3-like isoform X2 [Hypanus sabinus]